MCYNEIGEKVKSIITNNEKEYIINKSKFITKLYKVTTEKQIVDILDNVKKEYKDSTHICYAYIIDNIKRFNDDGEPGGTAGMPILNVLENNELNYVFAVVIRYFGGIKLGAAGLIRAYSKGVANAIKENQLKELVKGINLEITFNWENLKQIDYLLKDVKINEKTFLDSIKYNIDIPDDLLEVIISKVNSYEIIKDIYIEK